MNRIRPVFVGAGLLAAALLSGCADMPWFGGRTPSGPHPRADGAARPVVALREGIELYNDGDFNGAIRRLAASDVEDAPVSTRVKALKYTAFSYCVTSRPVQCRKAFDKALRLDRSFDLSPGEHGHPLWGPVFERARKDREG